ncbi:MAG TPA: tetratricopeptide repeat protein [Candidatus Nitrosotenuis sp.]|jgi:tetratricopeptide (TPR) repeat protein|nr:tetratricopeptide repeat protein [Candidatus Nitrosotenuis sp.]
MKIYLGPEEQREVPELAALAQEHVEAREFERAVEVYGRILEILSESPARPGLYDQKASVRNARAQLFIQLGKWQEALEDIDRVLSNQAHLQDLAQLVRAQVACAQIHCNYGEYSEAIHNLEDALGVAEDKAGPLEQAQVHLELGTVFARIGEHQRGLDSLERACQLLEGQEQISEEARQVLAAAYTQRGLAAYRERALDQALAHYRKSLDILGPRAEDTRIAADTRRYMGILAASQGNYSEALRHHREALQIYRLIKYPLGMAKTYNSIGQTCLELSRLDESLFFMRKAHSLSLELGADAEIATIYGKLGNIYMQREEFDRAVEFHLKDLELSGRFGNYRALAFAFRNLGLSYRAKGDFEEALHYLRESLKRFEELQDQANSARVHLDLARVWLDRGRLSDAEEEVSRGRDILAEGGRGPEEADALLLLGCIHRMRGRAEEAEHEYLRVLAALASQEPSGRLAETHYELGQLYRETGRLAEASQQLKECIRLSKLLGIRRLLERSVSLLEKIDELELVNLLVDEVEHQMVTGP